MQKRWTFVFLFIIMPALVVVARNQYEGFGAVTTGGEGGEIYHVTSLDNSGPGTLRDAVSSGNRMVVFDVAGEIVLSSEINIRVKKLTIDGATAPEPGITIKKTKWNLVPIGVFGGAQDIIIRHLRVQGLWSIGHADMGNHAGTMRIAGDDIRRIILDHITTRNAADSGLDIWGDIRDVTIQYCLIANSLHPQTISDYPAPYRERRNISIHHCIYANNEERNPQMRALTRTVDYVNNIVYNWVWYGIRVKNKWKPGEPKVTANIINNVFIPGGGQPSWALVYGKSPGRDDKDDGPSETLPQGSVYTESDMDSLYVSGNLLPRENMDHYSTIPVPLPIPEYARVTTFPASALADSVLPFVGTHYPLEDELALFNTIRDSLSARIHSQVAGSPAESPQGFRLYQNYPNPFNPSTRISFFLPTAQKVSLKVFNALGRMMAELLNEERKAGMHMVDFDGQGLSSGFYFYRIETEQGIEIRKMLLIQ